MIDENFIRDPKNYSNVEIYINRDTLESRINDLTNDQLKDVLESWKIRNKTGKWPITGTIMEDWHNEFFKDSDIPKWQIINQLFYIICREGLRRHVESCDSDE